MALRSSSLAEIRSLDPIKDHQRIAFLTCRRDFPFDSTRALEFALLRTFGVPSVATTLERTGEFTKCTQRRYDDTDIIVSEMLEHGYDSERGAAALNRMNEIHSRFKISNSDYLYVLSTFIFEVVRWIERFGWRKLIPEERIALFHFWRQVGIRMGIEEIPESYEEFEAFNIEFERERFRFTEAGRHVAVSTINMFGTWFPWPLSLAVAPVMHAMIDEPLLRATGLKPAPAWLQFTVAVSLRVRGLVGQFFTTNHGPVLRTEMKHRSHPCGYAIEKVGPPVDKAR